MIDPDFKVKFKTVEVDCGTQQGLGVWVGQNRKAISLTQSSPPAEVAQSLRNLADWLDAQP